MTPATGDPFAIEQCGSCQSRLALRLPSLLAPASLWLCRGCCAAFIAAPQLRDGRPFFAGIRPGSYYDIVQSGRRHVGEPISARDELAQLNECFKTLVHEGRDSRQHPRYPLAKRVRALSLTDDLRVVGQPFNALTVNVSTGGIAILQSCIPSHSYLAIDFSDTDATLPPVLLKQLRVRPIGPAYEVAGEFVSRIET
jgi:hypothetical protein